MIGSIAANSQSYTLNNNIVSKALESINRSASSFGTAMKALYNFQYAYLAASRASEPPLFSTAGEDTAGRMSDVKMYTDTLNKINSNFHGPDVDYTYQKNMAGLVIAERGSGGIVSLTA